MKALRLNSAEAQALNSIHPKPALQLAVEFSEPLQSLASLNMPVLATL